MSEKRKTTAMELLMQTASKSPPSIASTRQAQPKVAHKPPKRLNTTQAEIWNEVIATVELQDCDLFLFETLVCLLDQQRILQLDVNKNGPIIKQANSRPMHNPAATALRHLEPQLTRCFKELGMSPATRKRLKLDCRTNEEFNEWAEF